MKRLFDLIISGIALIVLSPVMIIIALIIKLQNQGSVIFKQKRVGKDNKNFTIYKFRSMWENAPEVASNDLKNPEEHITPIGKILRKTSLDELPQLLNILKGDMSLVGPRPVINDSSEKELLSKRTELGICKLMPGLTGWAQVNGRDDMSTERKIELEAEYLKNKSFILDLKILWLTFFKVFRQEGVIEGAADNIVQDEAAVSSTSFTKSDEDIKHVI